MKKTIKPRNIVHVEMMKQTKPSVVKNKKGKGSYSRKNNKKNWS